MIKGTTKSEFQFEIQEEIFDDYELLETLLSLYIRNQSKLEPE